MLRDRPAPKTEPTARDQAIKELGEAMAHLNRAAGHVLTLSALAPEMSPARHDRERIASQIERLHHQARNRRSQIRDGA